MLTVYLCVHTQVTDISQTCHNVPVGMLFMQVLSYTVLSSDGWVPQGNAQERTGCLY